MTQVVDKSKYEIGQKILIKSCLKRLRIYRKREWLDFYFDKPKEVFIVGIRTLSDGEVDGSDEDGYFFVANNRFKALLVTESIYRKPFLVRYKEER